jgi:hypothetical protein
MEKRICTDCGHGYHSTLDMICLVRQKVKTFYSTGTTVKLYMACDSANPNGECGKFIPKVGVMSQMVTWWQSWWDNYYEKRSKKNLHR